MFHSITNQYIQSFWKQQRLRFEIKHTNIMHKKTALILSEIQKKIINIDLLLP